MNSGVPRMVGGREPLQLGSARRSLASPKSARRRHRLVGAARHHHVLRLQIAVDDLELVREMESFRDIAHQANGLREAEPAVQVVRSESSSPGTTA